MLWPPRWRCRDDFVTQRPAVAPIQVAVSVRRRNFALYGLRDRPDFADATLVVQSVVVDDAKRPASSPLSAARPLHSSPGACAVSVRRRSLLPGRAVRSKTHPLPAGRHDRTMSSIDHRFSRRWNFSPARAPPGRRWWRPNKRRSRARSAFRVLLHEARRFLWSIMVTFGRLSAR